MTDLTSVFADLRGIMLPYAVQLDCTVDGEDELRVDTKHIQANKKPLWFGGVQIKKRYVSYHLMPVYVNPRLLNGMSPELKKHMQGKSCFSFTASDALLFKELAALTEAGFRDYQSHGYVEAGGHAAAAAHVRRGTMNTDVRQHVPFPDTEGNPVAPKSSNQKSGPKMATDGSAGSSQTTPKPPR